LDVIGIDWGSSNRRAYWLEDSGVLRAQREDEQGVLAVAGSTDFAVSLASWIGDWRVQSGGAVILSGMIGSHSGWQEAPYLEVPLPLDRLPAETVPLAQDPRIRFVPGLCQREPGPDVMRGEEMQLLGAWKLSAADGWYVLPGTHSKWALLRDGVVQRFHTFMTGELYARLSEKGALAAVIAPASTEDDDAFLQAVRDVRASTALAQLFSVRSGVLLGSLPSHAARARLSGLLIGEEFAAMASFGASPGERLHILGSSALARRYDAAARMLGHPTVLHDPVRCHLRALAEFAR